MRRLKAGDVIKHIRTMDVAYLVTDVTHTGLKGLVINQGYVKSFVIGVHANWSLSFKDADPKDWSMAVTPTAICLRNAEWKQIDG